MCYNNTYIHCSILITVLAPFSLLEMCDGYAGHLTSNVLHRNGDYMVSQVYEKFRHKAKTTTTSTVNLFTNSQGIWMIQSINLVTLVEL